MMGAVPFSILLKVCCFCLFFSGVQLDSNINNDNDDDISEAEDQTTNVFVSELSRSLSRPVLPYHSYVDVYPTRYDVPPGLSIMLIIIQPFTYPRNCGNFTVHLMIQQGGLPLVNQSSQSFPDNYFLDTSSLFKYELALDRAYQLPFPQPKAGPWFIVPYTKESVDGRIRQKGLFKNSDSCAINYISRLLIGPLLQTQRLSLMESHSITVTTTGTAISFSVPISTYSFQISVSHCSIHNCSVSLKYKSGHSEKGVFQECHNVDLIPCHFHIASPHLGDEQTVVLKSTSYDPFDAQIHISPSSCANYMTSFLISCVSFVPLSRISTIAPGFSSLNYVYFSAPILNVTFGRARTLIIPFHILHPNDIGQTLSWWMHILSFGRDPHLLESGLEVHVCGGLAYDHLPDLADDTFDVCQNMTGAAHVSLRDQATTNQSMVYVPYPKAGIWHIVLQATCFYTHNGSQVPCPLMTTVDMNINIQRCVRNKCGGKGDCLFRTIGSELITYSACKCYADYRGYGCQDDSQALSSSVQLAGAFLLTLSNLMFLPAIAISTLRRFYLEAFVYTYTMFFSTFYHACDGDRIEEYRLCIIPFNVLQSADFFGSSSSVWITLVAMASIRIRYVTPLLQIMGPFGLFIGVVYDKTSLYVIATPVGAGLLVLIISWGIKMYRRKKLYPSKRRYLFFLLPGIILASVAAVIYSLVETESNYKYLHSVWHACIALSVCLLLPPRNGPSTEKQKVVDSMTTPLTNIAMGGDLCHSNGDVTHVNGCVGLSINDVSDSNGDVSQCPSKADDTCSSIESGCATCNDTTELHPQ